MKRDQPCALPNPLAAPAQVLCRRPRARPRLLRDDLFISLPLNPLTRAAASVQGLAPILLPGVITSPTTPECAVWRTCDKRRSSSSATAWWGIASASGSSSSTPTATCQIVTFCEEPRPAYDRVNLTKYFEHREAEKLALADAGLVRAERHRRCSSATGPPRSTANKRVVRSAKGRRSPTTSSCWRPARPRSCRRCRASTRRASSSTAPSRTWNRSSPTARRSRRRRSSAAACSVWRRPRRLTTSAWKRTSSSSPRGSCRGRSTTPAPRSSSARSTPWACRSISTRTPRKSSATARSRAWPSPTAASWTSKMIVVSAGIKPRDDLARACGLMVGQRGGVVVDDHLRTSDPDIYAIGEVALYGGMIYGLVAPGYEMAEIAAANLLGQTRAFKGADMSTKLKLMGVDVASFGNCFADDKTAKAITFEDPFKGSTRSCSSTTTARACSAASWSATPRNTARCRCWPRATSRWPMPPSELLLGKSGEPRAPAASSPPSRTTPRSARATTSARARSATPSATRTSARSTRSRPAPRPAPAAAAACRWSPTCSRPRSRRPARRSTTPCASISPARARNCSRSSRSSGSRRSTS